MLYENIEHLKTLLWKAEAELNRAQRDVELSKERIKQAEERLARAKREHAPIRLILRRPAAAELPN
jgi:hypothetical protein